MTKHCVFFLLTCLLLSLCACSQEELREESVYLNLTDMCPYLNKGFERDEVVFGIDDKSDEKQLPYGWGYAEGQEDTGKFRWAIGRKSSVVFFCTRLSDKTVTMLCKPFNPDNLPVQAGKVFINDTYLETITFDQGGYYHISIPEDLLQYGSNRLIFKWRYRRAPADLGLGKDTRNLAVCFFSLRLRDEGQPLEAQTRDTKASTTITCDGSTISVPQGGVVEYYFALPKRAALKFGLSSEQGFTRTDRACVAIYSETGRKAIREFASDTPSPEGGHRVNLDKFGGNTVKIAFSNRADNARGFSFSLINPLVATASKVTPDTFAVNNQAGQVRKVSQPEAKPLTMPPVFIYLIDTLRADHLSCYGYERKTTPCIDAFAKDGVLFRNAFANASWTKPAVGSILTGLYPNKHGGEDQKDRLSGEVMTLSEILQSHGYRTLYITSNGNVTREYNFDQGNTFYADDFLGFYRDHFEEARTEKEVGTALYHSSEFVNLAFSSLVESNPDLLKEPIFAYLHTVDPHDPYTPEKPFLEFKKKLKGRDDLAFRETMLSENDQRELSAEDLDFIISLYDCEILHNDYYFGEFIKYLKQHGIYDNSLIVLVADHGEQFKEHGGFLHGYSIYNEEIHVPIIVKFPHREFAGAHSAFYVSQVDILPTILDYVGVPIPPEVDGMPMLELLRNGDCKRTIFVKEYYEGFNFAGFLSSFDEMKHITRYQNQFYTDILSYERFALDKDFHERKNLFDPESHFDLKSVQFKTDCFLEAMKPEIPKKEAEIDYKQLSPETLENLKALGYVK